MSLLVADPDKCSGCLQCEKVCSLNHEGECIPSRSRIKVIRDAVMGPSGFFVSIPAVCQQCEVPMCKEVCPVEAIRLEVDTGAYVVEEDSLVCIACRLAYSTEDEVWDFIGACAPISVHSSVEGEELVIKQRLLARASKYF